MNQRLTLTFVLWLFAALCTGQVNPPVAIKSAPKNDSARTAVLEHADVFAGSTVTELPAPNLPPITEAVRIATGNVKFVDGSTTVECDSAVQYSLSKKIRVVGNVKIVRDTVTIRGREGFYYEQGRRSVLQDSVSLTDQSVILNSQSGTYFSDEQKAVFSQNVSMKDSANLVLSDSLIYYRALQKSVVIGRVRIRNFSDNVLITGGYAEHDIGRSYSFIEQRPVLTQIDTTNKGKSQPDSLVIRAMKMEAFRGKADTAKRVEITDSVRIRRGDLTARSGKAIYFTDQNELLLTGNAIVWYQDTQMTGDSVRVVLRQTSGPQGRRSRIDKIIVLRKAFMTSRDTLDRTGKKFNQLSGREKIVIAFDDSSRLQRAEVFAEARSVYYLYDGLDANGVNVASGDRIVIGFDSSRVSRIAIYKGVEGDTYPEAMATPDARNLPGFRWRASERPEDESVMPPVKPAPKPKEKSNPRKPKPDAALPKKPAAAKERPRAFPP
ncbi:MAG: hypothetical protein IAF08_05655 [Rhizobacter sp.]|nr:hypothetical protein [Chlorobiales bacterium]